MELCVGHNGRVWVQRAIPSQWIEAEANEGGGGAGEADALLSAEAWRRVRKRHSSLPLWTMERGRRAAARGTPSPFWVLEGASSTAPRSSRSTARRLVMPSKMLTRAVAQKLVADFLGDRAPDVDDEGGRHAALTSSRRRRHRRGYGGAWHTPSTRRLVTGAFLTTWRAFAVFHCARMSLSSRIALSDASFASAASF